MSTEPVSQRTLRPLMPRPFANNGSTFSSTIPTHFCSLHNPKLTSWTQPLCGDYGGGKREMINRGAAVVSSRWNPTAEQVQALEEMYRRGTRTPTAEQIQQIAAKLRRFGKIEGKNVFYWFQNHKARDRQKKRRQLELLAMAAAKNNTTNINADFPQRKHLQSGLSRNNKYLEMEHPESLATMSKCSTGSKYDGGEEEECKKESWTKLELQQQRQRVTLTAANSTETSCRRPLDLLSLSMHKIIDQKSSSSLNLCKHLSPSKSNNDDEFQNPTPTPTLELFPVRGNINGVISCSNSNNKQEEEMDQVSCAGTKLVPNQFFEFLPTKK